MACVSVGVEPQSALVELVRVVDHGYQKPGSVIDGIDLKIVHVSIRNVSREKGSFRQVIFAIVLIPVILIISILFCGLIVGHDEGLH